MKSVTNLNSPNNSNSGSLYSLQKGKIPPQAVDLEEIVLGAMMIDKKGVDEVIDILTPESFYKEIHQNIFDAKIVSFVLLDAFLFCFLVSRFRRLRRCRKN